MRNPVLNSLRLLGAIIVLFGFISIMGCSQSLGESATVSYDASMTPPIEVQRQADIQCAKVNKHAVRRKTSAEDTHTHIRYDDFDCVDNQGKR